MGEPLPNVQGESCLLARARMKISEAIEFLDEANAPADIAAHLDTALSRLDAEINPSR